MLNSAKSLYHYLVNWYRNRKLREKLPHAGKHCTIMIPFSVEGGTNIYIGDNFFSNTHLRIEAITQYNQMEFCPEIHIGDNVSFGQFCHIGCINKVTISDGVLMGSRIIINDHTHGDTHHISQERPAKRELISKGEILIGENAWIGDGVAIMPNVTIGRNTIVGANSVVTKSLPDNVIAAGVPAKVVRELA